MILCAGLGTRLGDLSAQRPKPLLPVCDVPLARWALALLRGHGVRDVIVNTHHLGDLLRRELGDDVSWSDEPEILGTGGAVRKAAAFFGDEPFFLINGKIVVDIDLDAALAHHRRLGALATLVVRRDPEAKRWGAVDVDESQGTVRGIRGAGNFMFTGIHVIEPALLGRLPPSGFADIVSEAYLPALARAERIGAYVHDGYFWEHSTPERYLMGNVNLLRGIGHARHAPGPTTGAAPSACIAPDATLRPPFLIAPDAAIAGGAIIGPDVVVGRGARIGAKAQLERVVVWPGAAIDAPQKDAIVTPAGVFTGAPSAPTRP